MGKLTGGELLSDAPEIWGVVQAGQEAFGSMPPGPHKADDYRKALGFSDSGLAASACQTYDQLHGGPVTLDEVATLLGIQKDSGFIGKTLTLGETLIAQAKD